jgi:hypothetical protein
MNLFNTETHLSTSRELSLDCLRTSYRYLRRTSQPIGQAEQGWTWAILKYPLAGLDSHVIFNLNPN